MYVIQYKVKAVNNFGMFATEKSISRFSLVLDYCKKKQQKKTK